MAALCDARRRLDRVIQIIQNDLLARSDVAPQTSHPSMSADLEISSFSSCTIPSPTPASKRLADVPDPQCHKCHHRNPAPAKFCVRCGSAPYSIIDNKATVISDRQRPSTVSSAMSHTRPRRTASSTPPLDAVPLSDHSSSSAPSTAQQTSSLLQKLCSTDSQFSPSRLLPFPSTEFCKTLIATGSSHPAPSKPADSCPQLFDTSPFLSDCHLIIPQPVPPPLPELPKELQTISERCVLPLPESKCPAHDTHAMNNGGSKDPHDIFCDACGRKATKRGAKFCETCGHRIKDSLIGTFASGPPARHHDTDIKSMPQILKLREDNSTVLEKPARLGETVDGGQYNTRVSSKDVVSATSATSSGISRRQDASNLAERICKCKCGCEEFVQNPFKSSGHCSSCFHFHS